MTPSVVSPLSNSINSVHHSQQENDMTKSIYFRFGEEANMADSDEYETDDEGNYAEYKPSWAGERQDSVDAEL